MMSGADPRDPWSKGIQSNRLPPHERKPKVGWALQVGNPAIETGVADAFEQALTALDSLGITSTPLSIDLSAREPAFRTHLEAVLAARFGAGLDRHREQFDPSFVKTIENGIKRSGAEIMAAISERSALFREIETLFGQVDLFVTPTVAAASLAADTDPHADISIAGVNSGPIRAGWYPYTFPFNLTGHPALSMPCGWTSEGLPVGLQIVGRWYEEDRILRLARALDKALNLTPRLPEQ